MGGVVCGGCLGGGFVGFAVGVALGDAAAAVRSGCGFVGFAVGVALGVVVVVAEVEAEFAGEGGGVVGRCRARGDAGDDGKFPPEGAAQDVFGEDFAGASDGDNGLAEANDMGVVVDDGGEVVGGDDDGCAAGGDIAEGVDEVVVGDGVKRGGGLVEQEEVGFAGEGAGDQDALLLPAGEFGDFAAGEVGDFHCVQCGLDGVVGVGERAASDAVLPAEAVAAHFDDFADGDGEVPVDGAGLGHVADAGADAVGRPAVDQDFAARGLERAENGLEQRAFAGAVAADQGGECAAGDLQVYLLEHGGAAVADGDAAQVDVRAGGGVGVGRGKLGGGHASIISRAGAIALIGS